MTFKARLRVTQITLPPHRRLVTTHRDERALYISPGSVTDTDTEYRGISKYRYRYRSRYSKYRKIPNTDEKIPKKIGKSVFQFFKYNPLVIRVYARSGGQLDQIESFPRSVYSVIVHKIVMTIQYSLS